MLRTRALPLRLVRPGPALDGMATPPPREPVYRARCPAQRALDVIASKWAVLIIHRLQKGPVRFNALQREIGGISPPPRCSASSSAGSHATAWSRGA